MVLPFQLKKDSVFHPNFKVECRECGRQPTVIVVDHPVPNTELCGPHFFGDRLMVDWELWNNREEDSE